jgi:hypothetical protein
MSPRTVARRIRYLSNFVGPLGALRFLVAYLVGLPEVSLRVRGVSTPVWMRPRTSDPYVPHGIFTLRDCGAGVGHWVATNGDYTRPLARSANP